MYTNISMVEKENLSSVKRLKYYVYTIIIITNNSNIYIYIYILYTIDILI